MKLIRYCAIVTVLTWVAAGVFSQTPPEDSVSAHVGQELTGIREALEQLVELRTSDRHYRDVELILKRIDTAVRRLAPLEQRLATAQEVLRRVEKSLQALERMQEQHASYLQEQIREGSDTPRSETRVMLKDIERSRIGYEENIEATRLRIQEYENELALKLKQIDMLDERLLDLLDAGAPAS
jgi:chromosome segregation ATPase